MKRPAKGSPRKKTTSSKSAGPRPSSQGRKSGPPSRKKGTVSKPFGPHRERAPARRFKRPRPAAPIESNVPPEAGERLQKFLASAGYGSRRQCEELILEGRVAIDGKIVSELGTRVEIGKQQVTVDDEKVQRERLVYWWLNKPPGILCTNKDTHGRPTVIDLLPRMTERVFPVGRLDEESTGLILLTNDGELANLLTHPRYGVAKTYEALVAGKITNDMIGKLKRGIWLSDGRVRVHSIERIGVHGESTRVRIVLREGHNREIRRMFAHFEHKVMRLERVAIGPIKIRKLPRGSARQATMDEIKMLRDLGERARNNESYDDDSE